MSDNPERAGAPEYEFEFAGNRYEFPADYLLEIANRIDIASDAPVMPDHCKEAVVLVLEGLLKVGWSICPPRELEIP